MDQRLAMPVTTGLGLTLDEFSFGRYCPANFFGQSGARSSAAFADPDAGVCRYLLQRQLPTNAQSPGLDGPGRPDALVTTIAQIKLLCAALTLPWASPGKVKYSALGAHRLLCSLTLCDQP
jgi:hypothetical protein